MKTTITSVQKPYATVIGRLHNEVQSFYHDRLITFAIFGSVARGTATPDSDIDSLVIAFDLAQGRIKRIREFDEIENRLRPEFDSLKKIGFNVTLSTILKTPEEVQQGGLIFLDMIDDAVILFDRDHFFKNFLEQLRQRLNKLGARKIVQGDRWYWDLKPDYKPGDIFEI